MELSTSAVYEIEGSAGNLPLPRGHLSSRSFDEIIERYLPHPFVNGIHHENAEQVSRRYLAMSLGFPYVQAGAQRGFLDAMIQSNSAADPLVEITTVVGNFLTWDETGGHGAVLTSGNAGLPRILHTDRFHGNLCKSDLSKILDKPIEPEFDITGPYLVELRDLLGSQDSIVRCATMVSFERHAELVIRSLWDRLATLFPTNSASELPYFETHVGGDDPAEAYHIQMTQGMIDHIVTTPSEAQMFLKAFECTFATHIRWSADICL